MRIVALYFSFFGALCLTHSVQGQDWKMIVPLQTNCDDLRVILNVDTCKIPVSDYKFPDMWFNINISKGDKNERAPRGTVTQVIVMLRKPVLLRDFDADLKYLKTNLQEFKILPDYDLPDGQIYVNNRKGISFTVQTVESENNRPEEKYVRGVTLYPPNAGSDDLG